MDVAEFMGELKKSTSRAMEKHVQSLEEGLQKMRAGVAHVDMLGSVRVESYGQLVPLNQVATVSCPDARSFLISPWDAANLKPIEAGIVRSNLGLAPQSDGRVIRLKVPLLSDERRQDLVKVLRKTLEQSRVAVRGERRQVNELLKQKQKSKEISEDAQKMAQEDVQKITSDFVARIDQLGSKKEAELLNKD